MIHRRNFIHLCSSAISCSCLPFAALAQQAEVEIVEPSEDFGCSTLDSASNELDVIDFSPSEERILEDLQFTDYGTFVFAKRWRRSDGLTPNTGKITLGCHFFNGSEEQRRQIALTAQEWLAGELGNLVQFQFGVSAEESNIRISLGGNRNNSYVGRDNLFIPRDQQTMNLGNFNHLPTIRHEFGHALGLRHEHRFPGAIQFRENVVVSEMRDRFGWSTAQTYRNILEPLGESGRCIGDPNLNPQSIMMYSIPRSWTVDGLAYERSGIITERDRRCLLGVYSA